MKIVVFYFCFACTVVCFLCTSSGCPCCTSLTHCPVSASHLVACILLDSFISRSTHYLLLRAPVECERSFAGVPTPIYTWLDNSTRPASLSCSLSQPHLLPCPSLQTHADSALKPAFRQDEDHHVLRRLPGLADGTLGPGPRRYFHGRP